MYDFVRSMGRFGPLEGHFLRWGVLAGKLEASSMFGEFRSPGHPQMGPCWAQVGAFLGSSW